NLQVNIISIEEGKKLIIKDIIETGYALPDGMVLSRYPYMKDVEWGPVIFVENIGETNTFRHKYFYVFYGKMPDGAVVANHAINAETGEFSSGGLMEYNETNKIYLLTPEEAIGYAAKSMGIKDDIIVRATFYFDWDSMNYDETFSWKYEIRSRNNKLLKTCKGKFEALYIDPYVRGLSPEPKKDNGRNRFSSSRIYKLVEKNIKSAGEGEKTFVGIE
ncbi:MAG: hypothetical protein N2258_03730, partial [Brevinematales bacterium]|nr:hypothetical protein [Brevinematales bacterium]